MGFGFNCFGGISRCLHFRDQMSVSVGFSFFPCYVVGFSSFVGYNYVSIGRLLVPIYIFVIKMVMVRWGNTWKKKKIGLLGIQRFYIWFSKLLWENKKFCCRTNLFCIDVAFHVLYKISLIWDFLHPSWPKQRMIN